MKELSKEQVKDSLMKFWKHKWKTLREISKEDIYYLIWYYWEIACWPKTWNWGNMVSWIDELISEAWKSTMDERPIEKLKEISFWKYKGKSFEYIFENDKKYFWWLYESSKDREKPNKSLIHTMAYILKDNDCIRFQNEKKWLNFCKCCNAFHNIN